MLMMEITDTNNWKDILCSLTRRLTNVKMLITTQSNIQIQCPPYQNPSDVFHRNRKLHMESQGTETVKTIFKKNKVGGLTLSDFKT